MGSYRRVRSKKIDTPDQLGRSVLISLMVHSGIIIFFLSYPHLPKRMIVPRFAYKVTIVEQSPRAKPVKPEPKKKKKAVIKQEKKKEKKKIPIQKKTKKTTLKKGPKKGKKIIKKVKEPHLTKNIAEEAIETPVTVDTPESIYQPIESLPDTPESKTASDMVSEPSASVPFTSEKKLDISLGKTEFPFPWYLSALKNKINNNWSPMEVYVLRGNIMKVLVDFRIMKNGTVGKISIDKSSGVPLYDNATIRAVRTSVPFPPFPDRFKGKHLDIHFEFEYHKK